MQLRNNIKFMRENYTVQAPKDEANNNAPG
jgi:hypothetical protein